MGAVIASRRTLFGSAFHVIYVVILTWNVGPTLGNNEYVLVVISTNSSGYVHQYEECEARGAQFGRELSGDDTVTACAVAASPHFACDKISPPPDNLTFGCIGGYFAVALRGNCSFAMKAFMAQSAGYNGVIIYNIKDANDAVDMASDGHYGPQVVEPAFMVGHDCGMSLFHKYSYDKGYAIYVRSFWSYHDLLRYLVPFAAVIGVCSVMVLAALVVKLVRDRRRRNRRRLSKKHLKQIPTKKYSEGDNPDTCPICLDDFQVGDLCRVLPCEHVYHCICIDPWLLKNRRVCPICKRKVFPKQQQDHGGGGGSNSDSDTDETPTATTATATTSAGGGGGGGPSGVLSTPERTPLLVHDEERNLTVGNSTFYGVYAITGGGGGDPSSSIVVVNPADQKAETAAAAQEFPSYSRASTSFEDEQASIDDPIVDVSARRSLLPHQSSSTTTDECAGVQPGFVTASSSLREGYANPNFVIDPQELAADLGRAAATSTKNSQQERW